MHFPAGQPSLGEPASRARCPDLASAPGRAEWKATVQATVQDSARLAALQATGLLDSPAEEAFDRFTRLASRLTRAPIAAVSLVDEHRQFFKSALGFAEPVLCARGTPLSHSFCQHVVALRAPLVVSDARENAMLCDSPAVSDGLISYLGVPLVLPEGAVIGALCVIDVKPRIWAAAEVASLQEIAEMAMTQIALRDSGKRYRELAEAMQRKQNELRVLFDFLPAMICFKDTQNNILRINQRMAGLAGKPVRKIEGQPCADSFPSDAAKFYADDLEVIRSGRPMLGIIETLRDSENKETWLQTDKIPVHDEAGNVTGVIVMALDLTERRRAEESIRKSEERFSSAFDNAPVGLAHLSLDCRWLKVNRALCEMLGYSETELLTLTSFAITHPDDVEPCRENVRRLLAGEITSYESEKRYLHARGGEVAVSFHLSLIHGQKNAPASLNLQIKDITERKLAEARVIELNRQLVDLSRQAGMAEIATGVLHNVGNVLNSANVSLELATAAVSDLGLAKLGRVAAVLREHAHDLPSFLTAHPRGRHLSAYLDELAKHTSAGQATALVEFKALRAHIDHISEIVVRQQSYAHGFGLIEILSINEVVDDALCMNGPAADGKDFALVSELDPGIPPLPLDRHKVTQILVNLIRNARHALSDGNSEDRRLTVRTRLGDSRRLQVVVEDNGIGIPAGNLPHIFEYGFTTRKTGHGFGLHSCAVAAQEMGGSLHGTSAGHGQGAVFTLELPAGPADPA